MKKTLVLIAIASMAVLYAPSSYAIDIPAGEDPETIAPGFDSTSEAECEDLAETMNRFLNGWLTCVINVGAMDPMCLGLLSAYGNAYSLYSRHCSVSSTHIMN